MTRCAAVLTRTVEQAQLGDFAGDGGDLLGTVVMRGAHEREQTRPRNLPDDDRSAAVVDAYSGAGDTLKDRAHQRRRPPAPRPESPRPGLRIRERTRTDL